jgi:hypothetical protein
MEAIKPVGPKMNPANEAQASLFNKAKKQNEAVVGIIMQGVDATPQPAPEGVGERVDIKV